MNEQMRTIIRGNLNFLKNTQILDRPGKHSPGIDACLTGDGCHSNIIKNKKGEWAGEIHGLPGKLAGPKGQVQIPILDSNVFTTISILYPLFMIEDPHDHFDVQKMRDLALKTIPHYKRGKAYSFWREMRSKHHDQTYVGPPNLYLPFFELSAHLLTSNKMGKNLIEKTIEPRGSELLEWIMVLQNKELNPYGLESAFNIPNDSDDTSTIVAIQKITQLHNRSNTFVDLAALREILHWRDDKNRSQDDPRTSWWKGDATGAYLTWMKDEDSPLFEEPQSGVIPLAFNNVDCVVNANILFSLGLNQMLNSPGVNQASKTLLEVAKKTAWKSQGPKKQACGLYYPQQMIFPYSLSRAYRDGKVRNESMTQASQIVLRKILLSQYAQDGSFSGGPDKTKDLSTALAVTSMLNFGRKMAQDIYLEDLYDQKLHQAIHYLLTHAKKNKYGVFWDPGLFFSASFWNLAHWRSTPYTNAMVLEALIKYVLHYEKSDQSIWNSQIRLNPSIH